MVLELHILLELLLIPFPPPFHIVLVLQPVDNSDDWDFLLANELRNQIIVDAENASVFSTRVYNR
jgi:hypothetical protein